MNDRVNAVFSAVFTVGDITGPVVEEVTEAVLKAGRVATGEEEEAETVERKVEFTYEFTGAVGVDITIAGAAVETLAA